MVNRYGAPTSLEDFSQKMQLLNAIGYQGIFEAAAHKLNETGGVMLWKLDASTVAVVNRMHQAQSNLLALVDIYDITGKNLLHLTSPAHLNAADVKQLMPLRNILASATDIRFVILNLKDKNGRIISHNAYWLAPQHNF